MYLLTTIFGCHQNWSFMEQDRFSILLDLLAEINGWYQKPLTLRVWVEDEGGRNVGTGGRKFDLAKYRTQVGEYMAKGDFRFLELVTKGAKGQQPDLYFDVIKHVGFEQGQPSPRTPYGPAVSVTLAVHHDLLSKGSDVRFWINAAQRLFTLLDGVMGTATGERPWGIRDSWGVVGEFVEVLWTEIPNVDYRWGYKDDHHDMATTFVRPTWGYFLGPEHVKALGGMESVLGLPGMAIKQPLDEARAFVALTETPHALSEAEQQLVQEILRPLMA
jgi:hypothetical protein